MKKTFKEKIVEGAQKTALVIVYIGLTMINAAVTVYNKCYNFIRRKSKGYKVNWITVDE